MLVPLKLHGKDADVRASSSWTFFRDHIVNLGRLVVIIRYIVIRVILVVKSEVDAGHGDAIKGCGSIARHFGRVNKPGGRLHIQVGEYAERIVLVVDDSLVNERVHVAAHEDDLVAALFWSVVRLELG